MMIVFMLLKVNVKIITWVHPSNVYSFIKMMIDVSYHRYLTTGLGKL